MTFEEFEKEVTKLTNNRFVIREKLPPEQQPTPRSRRMREYTKELHIEWLTGGMRGGNCWGGEPQRIESWELDNEPDFESLDEVLEHFAPQITFMEYKRLNQVVVEEDSRFEPDYYGNSSEYTIKKVELKKLYKWLVEKNFINSDIPEEEPSYAPRP